MNSSNYTTVITGLGGQGIVTLLKILGRAFIKRGYNVISSETHGLSQRGGNVTCFLRHGNQQQAPIPIIGSADLIVAMEKSTILNVLEFCNPDKSTKMIITNYKKEIKGTSYPSDKYISDILMEYSNHIYFTNIPDNYPENMFILGKLLNFLSLNREDIQDALEELFIGKTLDLNIEAIINGNQRV